MIIRTRCLRAASRAPSISHPDLLRPALCSPSSSKSFSSTSRCRSRIGGAPLSLPAEVNLRILEPPPQRNKAVTRVQLPKTVEVEGPLGMHRLPKQSTAELRAGKMTLQLPPYMSLEHNKETKKATLSVLDREERKQREMWGSSTSPAPLPSQPTT